MNRYEMKKEQLDQLWIDARYLHEEVAKLLYKLKMFQDNLAEISLDEWKMKI